MILDTLRQHRQVWSKKPVLRRVYRRYFSEILARCTALRPIVELGCGPGFFKEFYPDLITTDVEPSPWTDEVADGCALPFDTGGVGNLVMLDVFHHLAEPARFLAEAARVLVPGGRVIMLEPWTSVLGYRFYRHVHHEVADYNVDPHRPFNASKDAFDGNPALPRLYFSRRGRNRPLGHLVGRLHVVSVERSLAAGWLLSGGFRPYALIPEWLLPLANAADCVMAPSAGLTSLRALITLERPAE